MLRCIVRQSFANRTRKLLKLEVAVEQLHKQNSKRTATHHWRCKKLMMWNGVYAHFCFSVLVGFQGLIPLFRFPASCSRQANNFCTKWATDFGKKNHRLRENEPKWATDFAKFSDRLWENQRPTLGKWAPILGKSVTDFGKMSHRLSENEPWTLGKWDPATRGNSKQIVSKKTINKII